MSSILQKAKLAQAQKAKKPATNLIDLSKGENLESKIAATEKVATKKVEEDWNNDHHEVIDISHIKPEKKAEEEKTEEVVQQKVSDERVTWIYTKEMDEQEALKVAATQQQLAKKEEVPAGKKVMTSWVPQARLDGAAASATFEEKEEYFPTIDVDILTSKQEKPKQVYQYSNISRANSDNASSNTNPPRFVGGNKGGFKPLEMSEQDKKLQELDEKNRKEYSRNEGGFRANVDGVRAPEPEIAFGATSTQPPRFQNKKAGEAGGNFVALQKTEVELKQEEAMKRAEERLKEMKAASAEQVLPQTGFGGEGIMRRGPSTPAVVASEETTTTTSTESAPRPRFMNTKVEKIDNSTPLQQTEAPVVNAVKEEVPAAEEAATEVASEASKPVPRFVNSGKAQNGPNFKPIEVKEIETESKKYLTKKTDVVKTEKQEEAQGEEAAEQDGDSDDAEEVDDNGFVVVKDKQKKSSGNPRKHRGPKNSDKKSQKVEKTA